MFNRKEYMKQWHINNPEYMKRWHITNKESENEKNKQWHKDNPERDKQYRMNHRKEKRQWYLDHKEERKEYKKQYCRTPEGKVTNQRHSFKRRNLGFIPLNEPFIGCVGHHISQNFVIYIPEEVHKCLSHNIWTWQGMNKINKLAIEFL